MATSFFTFRMVSEGRKCLQTAEKSIFMQIWAILAWATRKTPKNQNQTAPTHYLYVFEQVYNLASSIFRHRHIMKEPNVQPEKIFKKVENLTIYGSVFEFFGKKWSLSKKKNSFRRF